MRFYPKDVKKLLLGTLIGLFAGFITGFLSDPGIFESFAYSIQGPTPAKLSDRISLVHLDPELLNSRYNPATGGFDRSIYPQLIRRIAAEKPRVIVLDVILQSASASEDIALLEVLASISPVIFADQLKIEQGRPSFLLAGLSGFPASLPTGYVNLPVEAGRIVREVLPLLKAETTEYAHLALAAARRFLETDETVIGDDQITLINRDPQRPQVFIPLGADGHARINFRGAPYPALRASTLLADADQQVVNALCADKIVLIGAADERMGDRLLTPFHLRNPQLPPVFGVEVLATVLDNIISSDFLREPSSALRLAALLLFALTGALLMTRSFLIRLSAGGIVAAGSVIAAQVVFSRGILCDPVPLFAAFFGPLLLPLLSANNVRHGAGSSATVSQPESGETAAAPVAFISYRSIDNDLAFEMVAFLENNGLPCWIAPRNIIPGRSFPTEIVAGLESASVLVLLFSGSDNLSRHILSEVSHAFDLGLPIIVFKTNKEMPDATFGYFLKLAHWLDTTKGAPEESFPELAKAVRVHIADRKTRKASAN